MAGDRDAYRAVVKEHGPGVRALLAAHLSDADTVDDLAQETFVAAYESLAQFDLTADLGLWIKGIARNKLLMHLRRVYRHGRAMDKLKVEAVELACPVQDVDSASAVDRLRECLQKLPERLMTVVKARYYERERVDSIASKLGTSVTAVSSLLYRGRKELEGCMGGPK